MDRASILVRFCIYWALVLVYGITSISYLVYSMIWRKSFGVVEEDSREVQPSCLSDPRLGRHRYIKREGTKLHYVELGDPSHPLVILVHGTPGFWFCWRKQISVLAEYSWVVAIDIRGCGDSDMSWYARKYRVNEVVEDICYIIKLLKKSSATLIFNEASCQIGWLMGHLYPQLITKLILINGPHPQVLRIIFNSSWRYYLKLWYLLFLQIPLLPEIFVSRRWASIFESCFNSQIKSNAVTQSEIQAYKYTFSRKEDWIGSMHLVRQFDLRPQFKNIQPFSIKCDTLLLMSTKHPFVTMESAYRSAEYAERIKIRIIDGAKNHIQITHSERINEELWDFLDKPLEMPPVFNGSRNSLVNRMFGAVKSPYSMLPNREYILEKFGG